MSEEEIAKQKDLIQLIRRIAREEASQALDEHLSDYEHKERPMEEACT